MGDIMNYLEYFEKWFYLKKSRIAETTYIRYNSIFNNYLLPAFGCMDIENITVMDIEIFISSLFDKNLSPNTIKKIVNIFLSSLKKAYRMQLIKEDVTLFVEPVSREPTEVDIITEENLKKIFSEIKKEPLFWQVLFYLVFDTGARRGELVAFRWSDLEENILIIQRSAYRGKMCVCFKKPKNNRIRKIFLSSYVLERLIEYKLFCKQEASKSGLSWSDDFFIFHGKYGFTFSLYPNSVSTWWRRFLFKNNIKHIKFHAIRHTNASYLLANGIDLKTVSKRLGHSSIKTTDIYLHLIHKNDLKVSVVVDDILNYFAETDTKI